MSLWGFPTFRSIPLPMQEVNTTISSINKLSTKVSGSKVIGTERPVLHLVKWPTIHGGLQWPLFVKTSCTRVTIKKLSRIFMVQHLASRWAVITSVRVKKLKTNTRHCDIINPDTLAQANTSLPSAWCIGMSRTHRWTVSLASSLMNKTSVQVGPEMNFWIQEQKWLWITGHITLCSLLQKMF